MWFIFLILPFVLIIFFSIWAYKCGKKSGNVGTSMLLMFLTGFIIGFFHLLGTSYYNDPNIRTCTSCGHDVAPDQNFCPHCGKSYEKPVGIKPTEKKLDPKL